MNQQSDDGPTSQATDDAAQDDPACTNEVQSPADSPAESTLEPSPDSTPEPASESSVDDQVMIGIRIREASRIYHFAAPRGQVFAGDYVVVDRSRGDQLARVVTVPDEDGPAKPIPRDVRPIVRLADADDREHAEQQAQRADEILQDMRTAAVQQDMGLYPVAVELNLDGDQGTAWFQAPDHVDFRPLLDEVQNKHDVRLNMQQANQRERARLVDGYDICGLRLCCSSWMTDFPHVGIRVAKDQDLSLNPDSISGVCGRLLCCLTFEHEVYREMRGSLPRVGKRVSTPAGMGKVIKLNVLQQKVTISLDDHPQRVDVPAAEIGMAVRTEDAPNQALIDAERDQQEADAQAAALRQAAAPSSPDEASPPPTERPSRRRRRRSRRSQSERQPGTSDADRQPDATDTSRSEEQSESTQTRPSRRRRRRKQQVVNQQQSDPSAESQDASGPLQKPEGKGGRTRRRRRRSRQPVNQPDQPNDSAD
ncbi:MAG: regulatory iron-sulfur-containing complex subunit RicT [Chloroflexi bacterium]|nr:regulatory iron-sulfur-containing complex subunit RicT [Chloroflexota bacterium]